MERTKVECELLMVEHAIRHAQNNERAFAFRASMGHADTNAQAYWKMEANKAIVRRDELMAQLTA